MMVMENTHVSPRHPDMFADTQPSHRRLNICLFVDVGMWVLGTEYDLNPYWTNKWRLQLYREDGDSDFCFWICQIIYIFFYCNFDCSCILLVNVLNASSPHV